MATPALDLSKKILEDILCLSALIASGTLPPEATWEDSAQYFEQIIDCDHCALAPKCLACIISE
jgi:hypothetical protein